MTPEERQARLNKLEADNLKTRAEMHERQKHRFDHPETLQPNKSTKHSNPEPRSVSHEAVGSPMQKDYPVEDRPTPYNRPMVLRDGKASSYVERSTADPTAAPIATGGSLTLNASDRAALNEWFQNCFMKQFEFKTSWFRTDWFPEFFAPMRDRINANFDKAFDTINRNFETVQKSNAALRKEITELRAEHAAQIIKLKKEFAARVSKVRKETVARGSNIVDLPNPIVRKQQ